ncbi:MAG: hypothetical protein WA746_31205 [Isosphaeraceae bacterium]
MSEDAEKQSASQIPPKPQLVAGTGSARGSATVRASATVEVIPRTRIVLDLPAEAAQALNDLISKTGDDPVGLFRKALGLYKLAEEAKRQGKAVGIATTREALETEFVGL